MLRQRQCVSALTNVVPTVCTALLELLPWFHRSPWLILLYACLNSTFTGGASHSYPPWLSPYDLKCRSVFIELNAYCFILSLSWHESCVFESSWCIMLFSPSLTRACRLNQRHCEPKGKFESVFQGLMQSPTVVKYGGWQHRYNHTLDATMHLSRHPPNPT